VSHVDCHGELAVVGVLFLQIWTMLLQFLTAAMFLFLPVQFFVGATLVPSFQA